jgi:hypothetical protein
MLFGLSSKDTEELRRKLAPVVTLALSAALQPVNRKNPHCQDG